MSIINWKDILELDKSYKNLINNYFNDKKGKYYFEGNILNINFDNWGLEKFYINKYYNIYYNDISKIYSIAILIQIGNWDIFLSMEKYLINFNKININIYFSIINKIITEQNIDYLKNKYKNIVILISENKGMDIGLFLAALHYIKTQQYNHDYIFKIHTKTNNSFRNISLRNLIGSYDIIINNIKKLTLKNVGMISGNTIYSYNTNKDIFIRNLYYMNILIKYLYNENINFNKLAFSAGTFFIIKNNTLDILNIKNIEYIYDNLNTIYTLDHYWYSMFYKLNHNKEQLLIDYNNNKKTKFPNNLSYNLITSNNGLRDCMIEHAVERLFGYICKKKNLDII